MGWPRASLRNKGGGSKSALGVGGADRGSQRGQLQAARKDAWERAWLITNLGCSDNKELELQMFIKG